MRLAKFLILALAVFWTPRPCSAGAVFHVPVQLVRAGESVELSWSGLPRNAHEVELEVSLDGGRWLRLSPELDASQGAYLWRIPPDLSGEARLRLRWGGEGYESDGVVATVLIEPATTALHLTPGDAWWSLRASSPAQPGALDRTQSAYSPLVQPPAISASPVTFDAPGPGRMHVTAPRAEGGPIGRASERAFVAPRGIPLRN